MRGSIFGRLQLESAGCGHALPPGKVGALLALLLLRPGVTHSVEELVSVLWDDQAADAVGRRRLRVTVSRLRSFLDDGDVDGLLIEHADGGYRLVATPVSLDRLRFEAAAAAALTSRRPVDADAALAEWRDVPYAAWSLPARARVERAKLDRLRTALLDLKVVADGGFARTTVRPPALSGTITRRRLVGSLPAVGSGQLIVVTAPAGFGKSTALAQWASEQPGPVAWLAPTPDHADPTRFWALAKQGLVSAGILSGDHDVPIDNTPESLEWLRRQVETVESPSALVIDDLHHLATDEATDAMAALVQALLGAGVTVALSSRVAVSTAMWRSHGGADVHAIGVGDLRFTLDEVAALFPAVDPFTIEQVWQTAEGWPIGIVSLIRSGAALRVAGADAAPGDLTALADYVGSEVLAALPDELATFVLHIAPLEAFTVSLCNAVTTRRDAASHLMQLRRFGLFVVETVGESDLDAGWFRFHHGIGAQLRRLAGGAVDVDVVHRRAARWHLARGFKAVALRYATAARDRAVIEAVAGDVMLEAVIRREFVSTSAMIRAIHPDDVVGNPRAHAVCFWIATVWLPQTERGAWLHSRARHFGDGDALVLLSRANNALREGRASEAVTLAEGTIAAIERLTDPNLADLAPVLAGIALGQLVKARMLQDTVRDDDPLFARAISAIRPFLPLVAGFIYADWSLVAALDGNEARARTLAQEYHSIRCTTDAGTVPVERTLIGSLLSSVATDDPGTLKRIANELERTMRRNEEFGNTSMLAMERLVAASIYRRAGDLPRAEQFQRLADSTIATFDDAPVFERLRQLLDGHDSGRALVSQLLLGLTPRQRAILPYLGTELSIREIASELHISVSTLRGHLQQVYARLGVHSRMAAARRVAHLDATSSVSTL